MGYADRIFITAEGTEEIVDDYGVHWHYDHNLGHIVADGDNTENAGYACDHMYQGYKLLVEYKYIEE